MFEKYVLILELKLFSLEDLIERIFGKGEMCYTAVFIFGSRRTRAVMIVLSTIIIIISPILMTPGA